MVPIEALVASFLPISELRGGIPIAIYYGVNPILALLICSSVNLLPILIVFFLLEKIVKIRVFGKIYEKIVKRVEKKKDVVEKYGYLGLLMFVAVPLPMTGVWTASLLAYLLGLKKLKAFIYISFGTFLAGIIVTSVSLGVKDILI